MEKGTIHCNKFQKLVNKRENRTFWSREKKGSMVQLLTLQKLYRGVDKS